MLPAGYIPKGLHHFGCRYAEACHYAISGFEGDQQKHQDRIIEMRTVAQLQSDASARPESTLAQNTVPLRPTASRARPYLPAYGKQHSISPFYMPDGHPQKYYMSGYTGFVPKARKYLGQSYPIITRHALQEHTSEERRLARSLTEPVKVLRPQQQATSSIVIYPQDTGLVPHYTGHIPSESSALSTRYCLMQGCHISPDHTLLPGVCIGGAIALVFQAGFCPGCC